MTGYDVVAFEEATPGTGTVYVAPALLDRYHISAGDDLNLDSDCLWLYGALYDAVTTPNRALLRAPGLKGLDFELINSILSTQTAPMGAENGITDLSKRPFLLPAKDKLNALSVNATDEITQIILFLCSGGVPLDVKVPFDYLITADSNTDGVAHSWVLDQLTWNQKLPVGMYVPTYFKAFSYKAATPYFGAARLIIKDCKYHPGVPINLMAADSTNKIAPDTYLNYFAPLSDLAFSYDNMPNVEILEAVVSTDNSYALGVKKIA